MSIATLARKSRARRGASRRSGWTLGTTKSGNCPGPCGGGAPAQQHSFRRLMKNKQQGGGPNTGSTTDASGGNCCFTTWKKTNDPKGEQSIGYYLWRKKQLTHNCIRHACYYFHKRGIYPPSDFLYGMYAPTTAANPITAPHIFLNKDSVWTADPGPSPQVPGLLRNHENSDPANPPRNGWGTGGAGNGLHLVYTGSAPATITVSWGYNAGRPEDAAPQENIVNQDWKFYSFDALREFEYALYYKLPAHWRSGYRCALNHCDNVGCKCNCNKSMGGTACCVVHKTMLPLSNSENIAWVVEDRTCLQTSKPDPRNPNTC